MVFPIPIRCTLCLAACALSKLSKSDMKKLCLTIGFVKDVHRLAFDIAFSSDKFDIPPEFGTHYSLVFASYALKWHQRICSTELVKMLTILLCPGLPADLMSFDRG